MARTARRVVSRIGNTATGSVGTTGGDSIDGDVGSSVGNDALSGTVIIDPADIGGPDSGDNGSAGGDTGSDSTGTRRRGRRPGSTQKKVALDVSGVEQLLFSVHAMLAGITKTPELVLAPAEAKTMAEAMGKVSRHYDVTVGAKAMDWANMAMVAGMIYGPRIVAMRQRGKTPTIPLRPSPAPSATVHAAPPKGNGNNVVNIPGLGEMDLGSVP